jgi:hypothetical protein
MAGIPAGPAQLAGLLVDFVRLPPEVSVEDFGLRAWRSMQ